MSEKNQNEINTSDNLDDVCQQLGVDHGVMRELLKPLVEYPGASAPCWKPTDLRSMKATNNGYAEMIKCRTSLKDHRKGVGWSIRELARRSGVSASTISRFESGKCDIYLSHYGRLWQSINAEWRKSNP